MNTIVNFPLRNSLRDLRARFGAAWEDDDQARLDAIRPSLDWHEVLLTKHILSHGFTGDVPSRTLSDGNFIR